MGRSNLTTEQVQEIVQHTFNIGQKSLIDEILEIRKDCEDVVTYDRLTDLIERLDA